MPGRRGRGGGGSAEGHTFLIVMSLGMFLCCWPVAIASTIFAVGAMNAYARGDSSTANSKARAARTCVVIVSIGWGLLLALMLVAELSGKFPHR